MTHGIRGIPPEYARHGQARPLDLVSSPTSRCPCGSPGCRGSRGHRGPTPRMADPILYRSRRMGRGMREFDMYKFRTMTRLSPGHPQPGRVHLQL